MSELERTQRISSIDTDGAHVDAVRKTLRRLVLLGAPLGAALAMWGHPHAEDDVFASLAPVVETWLAAHLLLFASMSLVGVGLYLLLAGHRGLVASIGRVGIGIYAACYLGYVAIVGVTVGLLVRAGQPLPAEQQAGVAEVVAYLYTEGTLFAVGAIGGLGYLVAVSAIGVALRRAGAPLVPLLALVGSTVALVVHSGPAAVAGMGLFVVAVAWLEFGWESPERVDPTG